MFTVRNRTPVDEYGIPELIRSPHIPHFWQLAEDYICEQSVDAPLKGTREALLHSSCKDSCHKAPLTL